MTFGKNLKKYRTEAKLTQTDIAEKLGIIQTNIHRWESDKVIPSIEILKKLSKILNISADDLLFTKKEKENFKIANKKLLEKLQDLDTLSEDDRVTIVNMIEALKIKSKLSK